MADQEQKETKKVNKGWANLVPLSSRSPEEQFEIRSRGGRNAQRMNRERKSAQEVMANLLATEVDPSRLGQILGDEVRDLLPEEPTLLDVLSLAQIREAQNGSTRAFECIRDTAGYKPADRVQADVNVLSDQDRSLLDKVARRTGVDPEEH